MHWSPGSSVNRQAGTLLSPVSEPEKWSHLGKWAISSQHFFKDKEWFWTHTHTHIHQWMDTHTQKQSHTHTFIDGHKDTHALAHTYTHNHTHTHSIQLDKRPLDPTPMVCPLPLSRLQGSVLNPLLRDSPYFKELTDNAGWCTFFIDYSVARRYGNELVHEWTSIYKCYPDTESKQRYLLLSKIEKFKSIFTLLTWRKC